MPKICSVAGCHNNHLKERKVSFFSFPDVIKEKSRRYKWIRACGRQNADGSEWLPTNKYIYICSQHFILGKPNKSPNHPDYIPTIFSRTPKSVVKGQKKIERFNSVSRRRLVLNEVYNNREVPDEFEKEDCSPTVNNVNVIPTVTDLERHDQGFETEFVATPIPGWRAMTSEPSEVERLNMEISNLREERDLLNYKLNERKTFDSTLIYENDKKSKFYTGLCWTIFLKVFMFLNEGLRPALSGNVQNKDQFFYTLVKLRQNTKFEYLADQIGVDIFWKWLGIINSKLSFMVQWPDREVIFSTMPPTFRSHFPRLTTIIDCFEIFIETPNNLKARAKCYSSYKKHTTVKFLVACSPRGSVIFLSKAWGGRVSDNEITRKSGYISPLLHHPGDQILADRGFMLREYIATECSAELILPAFTKGKKQLSAQDVEKSRQLASVRILVERVIGLMKTRFSILQGVLPLKLVNSIKSESESQYLQSADQIVNACAIITNLGEGIQS